MFLSWLAWIWARSCSIPPSKRPTLQRQTNLKKDSLRASLYGVTNRFVPPKICWERCKMRDRLTPRRDQRTIWVTSKMTMMVREMNNLPPQNAWQVSAKVALRKWVPVKWCKLSKPRNGRSSSLLRSAVAKRKKGKALSKVFGTQQQC